MSTQSTERTRSTSAPPSHDLRNADVRRRYSWPMTSISTPPLSSNGNSPEETMERSKMQQPEYVPPDGGWGWVCVACSFVNFFLVVGLTRSFGAIYGDLRKAYPHSTHSQIATIPSIIVTLVVGLAIIAGALSKRFSCRCVAFCGGVICSTSICLCYYASTIGILTACFIAAGIGAAMSTTPGILTIAVYFRKRRALATGLCLAGTAIGSIIQPPLLQQMTRKLGFRYALLILGAVMYITCLTALSFRDPVKEFYRKLEKHEPTSSIRSQRQSAERPPLGTIFLDQEFPSMVEQLASDDDEDSLFDVQNTFDNAESHREQEKHEVKAIDYISYDLEYLMKLQKDKIDGLLLNNRNDLITHQNGPSIQIHPPVDNARETSPIHVDHSQLTVVTAPSNKFGLQKKYSMLSLGSEEEVQYLPTQKEYQQLPRLRSQSLRFLLLQFETHAEARYSLLPQFQHNRCVKWVKKYLYVDLAYLKNSVFLIVLSTSTLLMAVYPTGLIFMPPYSISQGVEKTMASFLLSISATGDLVGRIGCGWLLDKNFFSKQYAYIAGIAVLGISYLLYASSNMYWLMAVCACTYGASGGLCFLAIPILLADHHGAENLGSTFGIAKFGQAFVGIAIPPLAGYLRDTTLTFSYSFMLMGSTALVGGIISLFIPLVKRNYRRKTETWAKEHQKPDTDF